MKSFILLLVISLVSSEKLYHGVNVVYKGAPWIPDLFDFNVNSSFSENDYTILNNLGFNFVRFGLMWSGVRPSASKVDVEYLTKVKYMIESLKPYNISVLLEPHQDLLSSYYCGEGAPDWIINGSVTNFPFPIDKPFKNSPPSKEDCLSHSWIVYHASEDASKSYQELYTSGTLLQYEFLYYWKIIADFFKDVDNIYGYEIINEPWLGDYFNDPKLLIPKNANKNLNNLYQTVINTIRNNDELCNKKILFEPITFTIEGETGFNLTDICNNLELSYHGYFPPNLNINSMFKYHRDISNNLNISLFLTEFDLGSDGIKINKSLKLLNYADFYKQSWAVWEYKQMFGITGANRGFFNEDGTFTRGVSTLSRPYAHIVNGIIQEMIFNNDTKQFYLNYQRGINIDETRIYLGKLHYPNGYNITTNGAMIIADVNNYIYLKEYSDEIEFNVLPR